MFMSTLLPSARFVAKRANTNYCLSLSSQIVGHTSPVVTNSILIPNVNDFPVSSKQLRSASSSTKISTQSPFQYSSLFQKLKNSVGLGEVNKFALRRATIFHYEACTDKLDPYLFFEHFQLKDTLYSFYLVVQLHVWMCQVRSMSDGPEGRLLRNEVVERMWQDMDVRLSKIEYYNSSKRKSLLEDLLFHHQGAMFSYDEGLLTDDKTLANALWRTLFSKDPVEPKTLELAVKYVRSQLDHLRSISSRHWCLDGKFEWAPYPPLIVEKSHQKKTELIV